jgi:hypothetical protein
MVNEQQSATSNIHAETRESKQSATRNEQQQCERHEAKAMVSLPSSSRSKQ